MRKLRYSVAASLDGYIARPDGTYDWIPPEPGADFEALFDQYDTLLMGRRTFEQMVAEGRGVIPGKEIVVFSHTLRPEDHPRVRIVVENQVETVTALKSASGKKDIWLFGGGILFRSLAEAGLVDEVEVSTIPIILGEGIPLAAGPWKGLKLALRSAKVYKSGVVELLYRVINP
jgi:dihydrofolate reductase